MSALASYSPETIALHSVAVNSMTFAGFTVLIWDHILTFVDELQLIWMAPKGTVSLIFIANRYLVPSMLVVSIYGNFFMPVQHFFPFCKIWTVVQEYLSILSFISLHFIVALRVNAVHGGRRSVKRLLWVAGILYGVSTLSIATVALPELIVDLSGSHNFCVGPIPSYLWTLWIPSVVLETFLFILTVNSAHKYAENSGFISLYAILFRDGIVHFFAVSLCSIFSLVVWSTAGPTLIGIARFFALCMVNVVGSRLILNLKLHAQSQHALPEHEYQIPLNRIHTLAVLPALSPIHTNEGYRKADLEAPRDNEYPPF